MTGKLALISAIASLAAGSAAAQSPTLLNTSSGDWTGFYAGAQVGWIDVGTSLPGISGDDWIGGIILGYDYDFGTWVLGGGFDYDWTSVSLGGAVKVEDVWRLKARAGYKVSPDGLLYGVAGWADAGTDVLGDDDGWLIGAGYEQIINGNFSLGGEILYHEFNNFNSSGVDVDATTIQIRGAYRF